MHQLRRGHGALVFTLLAVNSTLCHAATFELDNGISGRWDTSLSTGMSISTSDPDRNLLPTVYDGRAAGINGNDGRMNFKAGDTISRVVKGTTELALSRDNLGLQISGKFWHDDLLENGDALPFEGLRRLGLRFAGQVFRRRTDGCLRLGRIPAQ